MNDDVGASRDDTRTLRLIKAIHTAIWLAVEAAVGYLLFAGFTKRADRAVPLAAVMVAAESGVFLANGASCPLTGVAERLGADSGSVTDIYLPRPLARSLPVIHVPILVLIVYLHRERIGRRWRQTGVRSSG